MLHKLGLTSGTALAALACSIFISASAQAVPVLDTSNDTFTGVLSSVFEINSNTNKYAQQFEVETTGTLTQLSILDGYRFSGDNIQNYRVTITEGTSPTNPGAVLASNLLFPNMPLYPGISWQSVSPNIQVTAGQDLLIFLTTSDPTPSLFFSNSLNPLEDVGALWIQSCGYFGCGAWAQNTVRQLEFRTYVEPTVTPLPAALPLFGAGLVVLGFVSRRRQRKLA